MLKTIDSLYWRAATMVTELKNGGAQTLRDFTAKVRESSAFQLNFTLKALKTFF
jgi:hypothetical protein